LHERAFFKPPMVFSNWMLLAVSSRWRRIEGRESTNEIVREAVWNGGRRK
jgi:hypothetical protein